MSTPIEQEGPTEAALDKRWKPGDIEKVNEAARSHMTPLANLRRGGALWRSGVGLFVLGLTAGLGLILQCFSVTPFDIGSASFATMTRTDVWPWALPLLATEGFALALAALGLCVISQARQEREVGHAHP